MLLFVDRDGDAAAVADGDTVRVDADERKDVDVDMLAKLASVEGSGLVTHASADDTVDETDGIAATALAALEAEVITPVPDSTLQLLPEDGKSNLGNDENAILFGLTVGRFAFVSDDLSVTCVADPGPEVSIGTTV